MKPSDVRLAKMIMAGLSHRSIADALNCSVYALGDRIHKLKRTLGVLAGAKITPEILQKHQEHSCQAKPTDPRGGAPVEYFEREITDLERRTELNAQALTPCLPQPSRTGTKDTISAKVEAIPPSSSSTRCITSRC